MVGDHGGEEHHGPTGLLKWLTSTDHKMIGRSYLITSFLLLLPVRLHGHHHSHESRLPPNPIVCQHTYNELFTMHGSIMMYLFAGPFAFGGLANYMIPLQVGAPDMAFPRLNALSYWLYLAGSITIVSGFFTVGGAADFGWVAYAPFERGEFARSRTGHVDSRADPHRILRDLHRSQHPHDHLLPTGTGNDDVPTAHLHLGHGRDRDLDLDRLPGTHRCPVPAVVRPPYWESHLHRSRAGVFRCSGKHFLVLGHPEVYILALPFFGIVTEMIATFSRKPVFGYKEMVFATIAIGALSSAVWAHHMFTTGIVLLPFFCSCPAHRGADGDQVFNWIGTMWRGQSVSPHHVLLLGLPRSSCSAA